MPALNEERGLPGAVEIVIGAVRRHFARYEIFIVDDGSTDRTGAIAEELAAEHPCVQAVHHVRPQGLGGVLREGLQRARMEYFIWVDGKGATTATALDQIFGLRDQADLVVPYATNQHERSWFRRTMSRAFHGMLNLLFRLSLKQYSHLVLCKTVAARSFDVCNNSYAWQAEILLRMIKSGYTYVQVGVEDNFATTVGQTKVFQFRNVVGVGSFLARMVWHHYVLRNLKMGASMESNSLPEDSEGPLRANMAPAHLVPEAPTAS